MNYPVLVFGVASDIVGGKSVAIKLSQKSTTVSDLKKSLIKSYPDLAGINGFLLAINNEYSYDDARLVHPHDEIALIPPTSGG